MINRVLIRLKIVQIIYAYYQNGGKNLETAEKELFFSLSKAYDLYNYLLLLMVEVTRYAAKRIDAAKHKLVPTAEELSPNMKFVENRFVAQLESNIQLNDFVNSQKKTWENETEFIKGLCEQIMQSDIYKEYMASETSSYEEDRELWRKLYKRIVFNNKALDDVLEDQSLYWNDDKEIVDTFVLKTIKRFDQKNGDKQALLPEFKDEEDQDFARRLFRRSILNSDYYRHLVSENARNWDLNRVAVMDMVIMQIALAEILSFPNIPVSVSLNEYVEIAKLYSTPKSGAFINGTLDGIVRRLKKENKLTKPIENKPEEKSEKKKVEKSDKAKKSGKKVEKVGNEADEKIGEKVEANSQEKIESQSKVAEKTENETENSINPNQNQENV